jgi:hypothetical protein
VVGRTAGPSRRRTALLLGAGSAAAVVFVHLWDPNQPGSYGFCPLKALTGLVCPFCGGLRAVHAMTHGDWSLAWDLNPAVVVGLPLAVLGWLLWLVDAWRRPAPDPSPPTARRFLLPWLTLAAMVLYGVLRNLPTLQPHLAALT